MEKDKTKLIPTMYVMYICTHFAIGRPWQLVWYFMAAIPLSDGDPAVCL
jgi:hypothetical protein